MTSLAPGGITDWIASRSSCNLLRAGSGRAARYSSTVFRLLPALAAEARSAVFVFFMPGCYRDFLRIPSERILHSALDFPFATAAVRNPESVLRNTPGTVLHAHVVHVQRIGVAERAPTLAIRAPRPRCC